MSAKLLKINGEERLPKGKRVSTQRNNAGPNNTPIMANLVGVQGTNEKHNGCLV